MFTNVKLARTINNVYECHIDHLFFVESFDVFHKYMYIMGAKDYKDRFSTSNFFFNKEYGYLYI